MSLSRATLVQIREFLVKAAMTSSGDFSREHVRKEATRLFHVLNEELNLIEGVTIITKPESGQNGSREHTAVKEKVMHAGRGRKSA